LGLRGGVEIDGEGGSTVGVGDGFDEFWPGDIRWRGVGGGDDVKSIWIRRLGVPVYFFNLVLIEF